MLVASTAYYRDAFEEEYYIIEKQRSGWAVAVWAVQGGAVSITALSEKAQHMNDSSAKLGGEERSRKNIMCMCVDVICVYAHFVFPKQTPRSLHKMA